MDFMKHFAEYFTVDLQQISEHFLGLNEVTHYTRPCLLCQPKEGKIQPKPLVSVLPSSFPSDLAYEMLKMNPAEQLKQRMMVQKNSNVYFSGKQLILISEDENKKRPSYIKEIMLFLHTLGYDLQEDAQKCQRYLDDLLKAKTENYQNNPHSPEERKKIERGYKKQKFVILCWSQINLIKLQNLILACERFASQTIIIQVQTKEIIITQKLSQKNTLMLPTIFQAVTPSVINLSFQDVVSLRKFHLLMLQREGRLAVRDMVEFCAKTKNVVLSIHDSKDTERMLNLSFLY